MNRETIELKKYINDFMKNPNRKNELFLKRIMPELSKESKDADGKKIYPYVLNYFENVLNLKKAELNIEVNASKEGSQMVSFRFLNDIQEKSEINIYTVKNALIFENTNVNINPEFPNSTNGTLFIKKFINDAWFIKYTPQKEKELIR